MSYVMYTYFICPFLLVKSWLQRYKNNCRLSQERIDNLRYLCFFVTKSEGILVKHSFLFVGTYLEALTVFAAWSKQRSRKSSFSSSFCNCPTSHATDCATTCTWYADMVTSYESINDPKIQLYKKDWCDSVAFAFYAFLCTFGVRRKYFRSEKQKEKNPFFVLFFARFFVPLHPQL